VPQRDRVTATCTHLGPGGPARPPAQARGLARVRREARNTGQARPAAAHNEHGRPSAQPVSSVQQRPNLARYTLGTRAVHGRPMPGRADPADTLADSPQQTCRESVSLPARTPSCPPFPAAMAASSSASRSGWARCLSFSSTTAATQPDVRAGRGHARTGRWPLRTRGGQVSGPGGHLRGLPATDVFSCPNSTYFAGARKKGPQKPDFCR